MASDLVAIVTGGVQGLGFAISERLLQDGYRVCLADVNEEKGKDSLAELQKKYGADKVIFVKCNVRSEASFEETFSETQKEFGRIDLLVNNAAIVDEFNYRPVIEVNLVGTIIGCQLAFKFMGTSNGGKGGVVINVASAAGLIKSAFLPVYTATKHGIVGLTRSYGDPYHLDLNGILFMALCPTAIRTPQLLETARPLKPASEFVVTDIMEPEYVARGVTKLLKDKCNGSTLVVIPDKMEYFGVGKELEKLVI